MSTDPKRYCPPVDERAMFENEILDDERDDLSGADDDPYEDDDEDLS